MSKKVRYPGVRVTTNGNQLVAYYTEALVAEAGVFYPITPSTEMGEMYQQSFAEGRRTVFGANTTAVQTEGEHAAQGGAIAYSTTGKRTVNFTSGQGIVYGLEQYYHAPGKLSPMVLEVGARALTKHALNVHCGHDDVYAAADTGWIILFAMDAQQAADQALILRKVCELSLTPGINSQDGFLTTHLERTFYKMEPDLMREFLGAPDEIIECPTEAQRELFGRKRRRLPKGIDLKNPALLGPVQNQEHYMNGVLARRNQFYEPILHMLEEAYREFAELTGRRYGLIIPHCLEDADTVFVSMGSAAANIEAAVDYLRQTRGAKVGSLHVSVFRPFPEEALVEALRGKRNVIVLERTDEPLSTDNPLTRDVRTTLSKAFERGQAKLEHGLTAKEMPRVFSGSYGLGSRDFRPEDILGAYEFVTGAIARKDGQRAKDGASYFCLGIDHPYNVRSADRPSLLPDHSIAVRMHSIGGWGMITTGKNLGVIIGDFGSYLSERAGQVDEYGRPVEVLHVSANPKYGSEKKGAPTSYFLVVAPERIRVNCDLRHVNVVLCCDPKAFTHSNPLDGLVEGGVFVWESEETPDMAWQRIPLHQRKIIMDKKIRVYILPGFDIARSATSREDLQLRMQGNAFLGAFFRVSSFLADYDIDMPHFREVVLRQYEHKFGRLGPEVVESNMRVMTAGFERVQEVPYGSLQAPDRSTMRGRPLLPLAVVESGGKQQGRCNLFRMDYFDSQFRAGLGYDQPASPLAAVGIVAAATGATASKFVARRQTPQFIPDNCTQCMACITACPDTAMTNTAQDIDAVLYTAIDHYVHDEDQRKRLRAAVPQLETQARAQLLEEVKGAGRPFAQVLGDLVQSLNGGITQGAKDELMNILKLLPLGYHQAKPIFATLEKNKPGAGGLFSIFINDLCKGCGECVVECGEHQALKMVDSDETVNARLASATAFLDLLEETPQKYLGQYDAANPAGSRSATLRNHLMQRHNYQALLSGDGACAGCGEKSILRALASITEAYMRPIFHAKSERLLARAVELERVGRDKLKALAKRSPEEYKLFRQTVATLYLALGGVDEADTQHRLAKQGLPHDRRILEALCAVLRREAEDLKSLRAVDGQLANGMAVMAMAAHTGCNTVYGSTPPNNPHPYPWLNSLFQDGATIGWMLGESFIGRHARRSVLPERLCQALLTRESDVVTATEYWDYTHFTDAHMTDQEIRELPKVWVVGGDGGMGDIGFQNVSKVVLQNRPNVKLLMLDTQVYSNTGGQNSDSSPMPGGFDMNQMGAATQGKMTEQKSVAEALTAGHGSPFVAQVSIADAPRLFKAILDALEYRGSAFFQCFTTCQPEHGVGDDMATVQARRARDSRAVPDFIFNPQSGETSAEVMDIKGNLRRDRDWWETKLSTGEKYRYTVAHWAATEARFRKHLKKVDRERFDKLVPLENILWCITQNDVIYRRYLQPDHRAFIPDFGVGIVTEGAGGKPEYLALSRQMVLFCVERRKAWRMLQSRSGVENQDYATQRKILEQLTKGAVARDEVHRRGAAVLEAPVAVPS